MRHLRTRVGVATALFLIASAGSAHRAPHAAANDTDRTIVHVLNRLGYGPRPGDVERVRSIGLARYIDQQLDPGNLKDPELAARLDRLTTLRMSTPALFEEYFLPALEQRMQRQRELRRAGTPPSEPPNMDEMSDSRAQPSKEAPPRPAPETPPQEIGGDPRRRDNRVMGELIEQRLLRAVYSERQLEEVLVDFWFNHFNVFAGKGVTRLYLTEYERDVIRPNALGSFRELLGAVAKSPAMLFYLDNWMNTDPSGPGPMDLQMFRRRPRAPQGQNQPAGRRRGLNENYARELMELHTLGVDGGYTQKDVIEVARAFTGWTIRNPRGGPGPARQARAKRGERQSRRLECCAFIFEPRLHDDKEKVVLGQTIKAGGGQSDGEKVLDILAVQPATARFIATKLARRFVADNPPTSLVDRAAKRFTETRGNIREVVRVIVTSPEFTAPAAYRAKVKSPLEFVVSALRVSGAHVDTTLPLGRALRELGMPLYFSQPPTGYGDTSDAWVNTGALVARMNFAVELVNNRLRGVTVDAAALTPGADAERVREALIARILSGDASQATRATIEKTSELPAMAALAIGAPEFQRR